MTSDQGLRHSQNIEHHTCTEQWNMNLIVSTEKKHRYRFANHGKSISGVGVWDVFFRNAETLGPSDEKRICTQCSWTTFIFLKVPSSNRCAFGVCSAGKGFDRRHQAGC